MRKIGLLLATGTLLISPNLLWAQGGPAHPEQKLVPTLQAAAAGDADSVVFNWGLWLGMLRGSDEVDSIVTLEVYKSSGTIMINGQPCMLGNYHASMNYQTPGMRAEYNCTLPNGQPYRNIEVISGQYAWDEDQLGAGLEPGKGTATARPAAFKERSVRLWTGPQAIYKEAAEAGAKVKVAVEDGKPVVTFPMTHIPGATAKVTLNKDNQAERVELRDGKDVTVFTYENYSDYNAPDDRIDCFIPGHIVEKKNGAEVMDINVSLTGTGNYYVVMPVPQSISGKSPFEN